MENRNKNYLISPIEVEIVLSLFSNEVEGEIKKEILDILNYKDINQANEI